MNIIKTLKCLLPCLALFPSVPLLAQSVPKKLVESGCIIGGQLVKDASCPVSPPPRSPGLPSRSSRETRLLKSMAPALQSAAIELGAALGPALAEALFGNPETERRTEELLKARLAEEARVRAIKEARRREELHQRLMSALKLSGVADLNFKGFDRRGPELQFKGLCTEGNTLAFKLGDTGQDDGLRPRGTSFFGLGGDAPTQPFPQEPVSDPMVVDLRNLQRAAFLAGSATAMLPGDAQFILDEALNAANGDTTFAGAGPTCGTMPVISEKGLLAFQQANVDYARARDGRMRATETFNQAQRRREIADQIARAAKEDLERAKAAMAEAETLEKKRKLMAEVFAATKAEAEAWARAKLEFDAAERRTNAARENTLQVLRDLAAGKELAPMASLPGRPSIDRISVPPPSAAGQGDPDLWQKLVGGYYFGTAAGEDSAQWYADRYVATGNPAWYAGGLAASLWTSDTYLQTASTLAIAQAVGSYLGRVGAGQATQMALAPRHIFLDDAANIDVNARNVIYHIKYPDGVVKELPWRVPARIIWPGAAPEAAAAPAASVAPKHVFLSADEFMNIDVNAKNIVYHIKGPDGVVKTMKWFVDP